MVSIAQRQVRVLIMRNVILDNETVKKFRGRVSCGKGHSLLLLYQKEQAMA